jgi:hypothetical protein
VELAPTLGEENPMSILLAQVIVEVEERLLVVKKLLKSLKVKNTNKAAKDNTASKGTMN